MSASLTGTPAETVALHNRAVVLRSEGRIDEALVVVERMRASTTPPPETELLHGHLLIDQGAVDAAILVFQSISQKRPDIVEAHRILAQLLPQVGRDGEALDSFRAALAKLPGSGLLWLAALGAAKARRDAAQVIALAQGAVAQFGRDALLDVLVAQAESWEGEYDAAIGRLEHVIKVEPDLIDAHATLAQIAVRTGDLSRAEVAALTAIRLDATYQTAWATLDVIWRLRRDSRAEWLGNPDAMIGIVGLDVDVAQTAVAIKALHVTSSHPAEQTLRGGTQTLGDLFARHQHEIVTLRRAVEQAVTQFIASLHADSNHPFYGRNTGRFTFGGSWSVRLRKGGLHVAHIHPAGWLSSALYLELPPGVGETSDAGALAFGVPEAAFGIDLAPTRIVRPRTGTVVLFPSYFWHATRPFEGDAERLTVAFDALPA